MIVTSGITVETKGECDIIDITPQVSRELAATGIKQGTVLVFVTGSTAGVTTIEYEPGLVADLQEMWQRLITRGAVYHHDRTWGDGNGYSHLRAALLGASLTIPFHDARLILGTWQQIVVIDFDNRPRSRQITVQISGQ